MTPRLKKLNEQTLVITGASSGIGLATARLAARRGARVVLVSRDETDLQRAVEEIRTEGGEALYVVADVADPESVQRVVEAAEREYDGFDTWVNNAGVSIYGTIEEVPLADARRLFETNYWGVVNGSLAAVRHLRQRASHEGARKGGALINVGSILSETAMPLQGHYSASKHAVKGFTDSLRIELEKDGAPISVTTIEPSAIDTPYTEHARNYLGVEPKQQPPVYAPEVVARAILRCAERSERTVLVGGGAKMFTSMETFAPALGDRYKGLTAFSGQRTDQPPRGDDTLYAPRAGAGRERGNYPGHVRRSSTYTMVSFNPVKTLLGAAALGLGVALATRTGRWRGRGGW